MCLCLHPSEFVDAPSESVNKVLVSGEVNLHLRNQEERPERGGGLGWTSRVLRVLSVTFLCYRGDKRGLIYWVDAVLWGEKPNWDILGLAKRRDSGLLLRQVLLTR